MIAKEITLHQRPNTVESCQLKVTIQHSTMRRTLTSKQAIKGCKMTNVKTESKQENQGPELWEKQ